VLISGSLQNTDGPNILANYIVTNAVASQALGRPLSGGAANITIPIISGSAAASNTSNSNVTARPTGQMYADRINQVDLRFSKIVQLLGRSRATINVDLYNALNNSSVLDVNPNFAAWQTPTSIVLARFAKIGVQFDF
jgi:hypothetical protein